MTKITKRVALAFRKLRDKFKVDSDNNELKITVDTKSLYIVTFDELYRCEVYIRHYKNTHYLLTGNGYNLTIEQLESFIDVADNLDEFMILAQEYGDKYYGENIGESKLIESFIISSLNEQTEQEKSTIAFTILKKFISKFDKRFKLTKNNNCIFIYIRTGIIPYSCYVFFVFNPINNCVYFVKAKPLSVMFVEDKLPLESDKGFLTSFSYALLDNKLGKISINAFDNVIDMSNNLNDVSGFLKEFGE